MEHIDLSNDGIITDSSDSISKVDSVSKEEDSEKDSKKPRNTGFKTKECSVINFNEVTNTLDVDFDGYGIRIKNVKNFSDTIATVRYKGEIGRPNFNYRL